MKKILTTIVMVSLSLNPLFASLDDELVAYYKFDNTLSDSSGNGYSAVGYGTTSYINGTIGKAISFDGVDDYILAPITLPTTNFSVTMWINTTSDNIGIFSAVNNNVSSGHDRHIYLSDSKVCSRVWSAGDANYGCNTSSGCTDITDENGDDYVNYIFCTDEIESINELTLITYVLEGNRAYIYVNAVLEKSADIMPSEFKFSNRVAIGYSRDATTNYMSGEIDEVRIYNRVLAEDEIAEIYNLKRYTESEFNQALEEHTAMVKELCFNTPEQCGVVVDTQTSTINLIDRDYIDSLDSGWSLVGGPTEVTDMSIFDNAIMVWTYSSGSWKMYSKYTLPSSISVDTFSIIPANQSFWIFK
jgi:hypothetical protein